MPSLDVARLRKAVEHITAHPEEWDQGAWRCDLSDAALLTQTPEYRYSNQELKILRETQRRKGRCDTAFCLAGTIVDQSDEASWVNESHVDSRVFFRGQTWNCDGVARELTGLTCQQARALFASGNSLEMLQELSELYIAKAEAEALSEVTDV